jgi:uncharacterized protein YndB with AHSA1/START domain
MKDTVEFSPRTYDREIVISRMLKAPRELVFRAWTDPDHLINWWGPRGFTNTFREANIVPGGSWRFIMHGPDGTAYPNLIVFDEIIEPEFISFYHASEDLSDPGMFRTRVTFEEVGMKTRLTMRSIFPTAEERDKVVKEYRAIEGGNQTLDKLEKEIMIMLIKL